MKTLYLLCITIGLLHLVGGQSTIPAETRLLADSINPFGLQDASVNNVGSRLSNIAGHTSPGNFGQFQVITLTSRGDQSPDLDANTRGLSNSVISTISNGIRQAGFVDGGRSNNNARSSQSPTTRLQNNFEAQFSNRQDTASNTRANNAAATQNTFLPDSRSFRIQDQISLADIQTNNAFRTSTGTLSSIDSIPFRARDEIIPTRDIRNRQVMDTGFSVVNRNRVRPVSRIASPPINNPQLDSSRRSRRQDNSIVSFTNTDSLFRTQDTQFENDIIPNTRRSQSNRLTFDDAIIPRSRFRNDRLRLDDGNQFRATDLSQLDIIDDLPSTDNRRLQRVVPRTDDMLDTRLLSDRDFLLSANTRRQQRIVPRTNDILDTRFLSDTEFLPSTDSRHQQGIVPRTNEILDTRLLSDRQFLSSIDSRRQQRIVPRTNDILDTRLLSDRQFSPSTDSRLQQRIVPRTNDILDTRLLSDRQFLPSTDSRLQQRIVPRTNDILDTRFLSDREFLPSTDSRRQQRIVPRTNDILDTRFLSDREFLPSTDSRLQQRIVPRTNDILDTRLLSHRQLLPSTDSRRQQRIVSRTNDILDTRFISDKELLPSTDSRRQQRIVPRTRGIPDRRSLSDRDFLRNTRLADPSDVFQSSSRLHTTFEDRFPGESALRRDNDRDRLIDLSAARTSNIQSNLDTIREQLNKLQDIGILTDSDSLWADNVRRNDDIATTRRNSRLRNSEFDNLRLSSTSRLSQNSDTANFDKIISSRSQEQARIDRLQQIDDILSERQMIADLRNMARLQPRTTSTERNRFATSARDTFSTSSLANGRFLSRDNRIIQDNVLTSDSGRLSAGRSHLDILDELLSDPLPMQQRRRTEPINRRTDMRARSRVPSIVPFNAEDPNAVNSTDDRSSVNTFIIFVNSDTATTTAQTGQIGQTGQTSTPAPIHQTANNVDLSQLGTLNNNDLSALGFTPAMVGGTLNNLGNAPNQLGTGQNGQMFTQNVNAPGMNNPNFGQPQFGAGQNNAGFNPNQAIGPNNMGFGPMNQINNLNNQFGGMPNNNGGALNNQFGPNTGQILDPQNVNQGGQFLNQGNPFGNQGNQFGNQDNQFGNQGNQFGNQGNPFGNQDNQFGNQDNQFGNQGNQFGNQDNQFGNQGNQFGNQGNQFGNQANPFGNQDNQFGNQGNPFGNQDNQFGNQGNPFGNQDNQFGNQGNQFGNPGNFQNFNPNVPQPGPPPGQGPGFPGGNNQQPFWISNNFDGGLFQPDQFMNPFFNPRTLVGFPWPMMPAFGFMDGFPAPLMPDISNVGG